MAHPVEWIIDPPEYEWFYAAGANVIVVMTTTVLHTYFHLGRMHEVAEPDLPLALPSFSRHPPA